MDEADMAAERAEREAPFLLRASLKPVGPSPTGFCLYCEEPTEEPEHRFCDNTCAKAFEHEEKRRKELGL